MQTRWRRSAPGRYIELEWRNGHVYFEDGPEDWPRRGHEGGGGAFTIEEIRNRGREWFSPYKGLYDQLLEDLEPWIRVSDAPHGVVVTLNDDAVPCPTPCRFVSHGDQVYVYPATTEPREQLATTPQASLVVTGPELSWWSRITGPATLVDDPEWESAFAAELFTKKYNDDTVDPADMPIIRIDIDQWTSQSLTEGPTHKADHEGPPLHSV